MVLLICLQLFLPLTLLAWLALSPLRSQAGLGLQIAAILTTLVALQRSGLWLLPPWWAIWAYWALFAVALYRSCRLWPSRSLPIDASLWAAVLLLAALTIYSGWTAAQAWHGRQRPDGQLVELRFPLEHGRYLVVNGGANTSVNAHARTLARRTAKQRQYHGQSHALDLVAIDRFGFQARGLQPADPGSYMISGRAVYAPCDGFVLQNG